MVDCQFYRGSASCVSRTRRSQPYRQPSPDRNFTALAYSWPADRFAELLAGAGLVTFARLLHDPASERGFLDAHLLARLR